MLEPDTISQRIAAGRHALIEAGLDAEDAALDAEVLARHLLGWDRARLLAESRQPAPPDFAARYETAIRRRQQHEPVAFIIGHREFWGLDFLVTPATLVPRPETEIVVEEALRLLDAGCLPTILDIGTGSGCLAVTLAHEWRRARVVATDVSHDALLVARSNARRHHVSERVHVVRADLGHGLSLRCGLIVSNPPYVPLSARDALPADVVRYEPATALFGGEDGLAEIRRLFASAADHLAPDGRLIVEFGFGQEAAVRELARRSGWHIERVVPDLQQIPRTIVLWR